MRTTGRRTLCQLLERDTSILQELSVKRYGATGWHSGEVSSEGEPREPRSSGKTYYTAQGKKKAFQKTRVEPEEETAAEGKEFVPRKDFV